MSPVTPLDSRYGGLRGLDTDDHTGRLLDMFEDSPSVTGSALYPGGDFWIPANPVAGEWFFRLDSPDYRSIKMRSNWRCLSVRGKYGRFNPGAAIHRIGKVPHGTCVFENEDQALGNSNIRLSVLCFGDKQEAARAHGGTYSIDRVGWFCRVVQKPMLADGRIHYNRSVDVSGCHVLSWPGFSFMFQQTERLLAQFMNILSSHRDSFTLYMSHIRPVIRYSAILESGDDCIALRQVDDFVRNVYGADFIPPPIQSPVIHHNTLSEKQRMDLPQPPGDRVRSANCPITIAGKVMNARITANTVLHTYDGSPADGSPARSERTQSGISLPGTIPRPAVNLDAEYNNLFPTGVFISGLKVQRTRAPAVWVRDPRISGEIQDSSIGRWTPFNESALWNCPWKLPPHWKRAGLNPPRVCQVAPARRPSA